MRLRSIDMVRGLAALAVVFAHVDGRFSAGAAGVDFFFVVSGFVMAHVSQNRTASQFLKDRAWVGVDGSVHLGILARLTRPTT